MKKIIAGILAVVLTCSAAAIPMGNDESPAKGITASADAYYNAVTLTQDMTINGDAVFESDLDLNGHTLTVTGDMFITGSTFKLNGGTLNVKGSLYFQKVLTSQLTDLSVTTVVTMTNAADQINVDGDFMWDVEKTTAYNSSSKFTAGVITVKGNFTDEANSSVSCIRASGTHKVVFAGNGRQELNLTGWSYLNIIDTQNNQGQYIAATGNFHFKGLARDMTINSEDATIKGVYCTGKNFTINGDVKQEGFIELAGGKLTINGTLKSYNGKINPAGGTLEVKDDLYLRYDYVSNGITKYTDSSTWFSMTNANDKVIVGGNYLHRGSSSFVSKLTSGTFSVGGNFTDISSTSGGSFVSSSAFKLLLNGSGSQKITTNAYTTISQLEIQNPYSREIGFKGGMKVTKLASDAVFAPESLTINQLAVNGHDVTFNGDVKQAVNIDLAGKSMTVKGDLVASKGTMTLNGGQLSVSGDYRLQNESSTTASTASSAIAMKNFADVLNIGGDLLLNTSASSTMTAGTLYLAGNMTDMSTNGVFKASSSHKTVLNGSGAQSIDLPKGTFATLQLTKARSNYTFTKDPCWVTLITVEPVVKSIFQCTVSLSQTSYTYDGAAKQPTVTVKDGSTTLTAGKDYTVSYSSNVNAGTASVTINGTGNYNGSVSKTFTISQKNISLCTAELSQTSYTYDGTAKQPTVTVKDGSTVLKAGTDYTVSYSSNVNAGTAVVTITGKGNFSGSVQRNFTVAPQDMSKCTVVVSTPSNYFRGTRIKPLVTVKIGNTVVDPSNYTLSYTDNLMVGTAKVTVKGRNNYTGSTVQTYEIVQRSIGNCDITLSPSSADFTGERIKPEVSVVCNGAVLYNGNYTVSYSNNLSAGTATVTLTGKKNLKGTVTKTFKINQRSVNNCRIVLTADPSNANKPTVAVMAGDNAVYKGNYTVKYTVVSNNLVNVTVTGTGNLKDSCTVAYYH